METNLILLITDDKLRNATYDVATRSKKYTRVAKYSNVAWAQIFNAGPETQLKILCDSYLDYKVYNELLGFIKFGITHNMPVQVVIKDMLETYTFNAICNRKVEGTAVQKIRYKRDGNWETSFKSVRKETTLGASTWQQVEDEISPIKRLFAINKHFTEEMHFKEEMSAALLIGTEDLRTIPIDEAWDYCRIYGPAYGLDLIYLPISRESIPKEWLLNRHNIKLDAIHDEKARLNRVLQTSPIEYESQIYNQLTQIKWYQDNGFNWLPEFQPCPECGHPVNTKVLAHYHPTTNRILDNDQPFCQYCDTPWEEQASDEIDNEDPYLDLPKEEYTRLIHSAGIRNTAKYIRRLAMVKAEVY